MVFLIIGSALNLLLAFLLIPIYGLNGAAFSTMVASFLIMFMSTAKITQITNAKLPWLDFIKIIIASIIISLLLLLFPKTALGLIAALLIAPFIYIVILALFGALKDRDMMLLYKFGQKLGPFSELFLKVIKIVERFVN